MADKDIIEDRIIFEDSANWIDADYQVTARETRWIEKKIYEVNRQKAVAQRIFPTVPIARGCKEWIVEIDVEPEAPIFDDNFLKESQDVSRKTEHTFYVSYMHKDYRIAMTDADAVGNSQYHTMSLPVQTVRNLTGTVVDYREKVIWRGYDIAGRAYAAANNQGSIDTKVKGILNTSGINSFNAGSGDADIQSAGDGGIGQGQAVASLITDGFYGPYWHFMTPEVWSQLNTNRNATTGRTDLSLMLESVDIEGNKLIHGIRVTKALLPTVEASGSEANWAVIDPKDQNGNPTILIGESYPLSNIAGRPSAAVAANGKIIWAGAVAVLRPEAITLEQDIVYA